MIVWDELDGVKRILFGTKPTAERWSEQRLIIEKECREQAITLRIFTAPILKMRQQGWRLKKIVRWPEQTEYVFWRGHKKGVML